MNDVSLFVRVVHLRSFSAVARERGVPVSTISRRISRLEGALGMRLLERTTRRLALTDAGRAYHGYAERAVEDLTQGGALVRELQTEPTGRIRITSPLSLGGVITDALIPFMRAHADVTVELELAERALDLQADTFDLAIVAGHVLDTAEFVARPLWRSSRKLLYASPGYVKARGAPRTVDDLARHACISTRAVEGIASWMLVHPRARRRKFTFSPRLHVTDTTSAQRAVRGGLGIAMLPEVLCVEDVARGRLVRVLPQHEGIAGGLRLLYRVHRSLTAAVRAAVTHFTTVLPTMDPHEGV